MHAGHEVLDTYGAHRVRTEGGLRAASPTALRTLGYTAPSALWVEHRTAVAHDMPGVLLINPECCTSANADARRSGGHDWATFVQQ